MSLMKTLAKVAIGVAVAKGASAMMNKNISTTGSASSGGDGADAPFNKLVSHGA